MRRLRLLVLCLSMLLAFAGLAVAQEDDDNQEEGTQTEAQPRDDDAFLDVVTVTATKREESLQEIPIAVTAVSELQIERSGLQDIRDLPLLASSFNMNSTQTESQGSTLRIRGVGTTGNNIGLESAVGVFLDGVYLSRPGVALGDQLDVEAIEVLRGPRELYSDATYRRARSTFVPKSPTSPTRDSSATSPQATTTRSTLRLAFPAPFPTPSVTDCPAPFVSRMAFSTVSLELRASTEIAF